MRDLSIDLETLGTTPGSAILSIGAVLFDRDTGQLGAEFYKAIDLDSAMKNGTVSASTLRWWMNQDEDAKAVLIKPSGPFSAAILDFQAFVASLSDDIVPWGNGATFDVSILEHAIRHCGSEPPWHFRDVRDMRTLMDVAKTLHDFDRTDFDFDFQGVAHNALDDARHQARLISAAWRACK